MMKHTFQFGSSSVMAFMRYLLAVPMTQALSSTLDPRPFERLAFFSFAASQQLETNVSKSEERRINTRQGSRTAYLSANNPSIAARISARCVVTSIFDESISSSTTRDP